MNPVAFETVTIDGDYITLAQLLKFTDIISSGGMAKPFLAEYQVFLNGDLEDRRGKKVYPGDLVEIPAIQASFQIESAQQVWSRWYWTTSN